MQGRTVSCNLAALGKKENTAPITPRSVRSGGSADDELALRKLFVRSLSWETTPESLAAAFQPFGELEDVSIAKDRTTGKSRGFGFVTFKHVEAAQRALQNPLKRIDVC